jgi:hypothetical protein
MPENNTLYAILEAEASLPDTSNNPQAASTLVTQALVTLEAFQRFLREQPLSRGDFPTYAYSRCTPKANYIILAYQCPCPSSKASSLGIGARNTDILDPIGALLNSLRISCSNKCADTLRVLHKEYLASLPTKQ